MKRQLAKTIASSLVLLMGVSVPCFANVTDTNHYVTEDGQVHSAHISNEMTPYGDPAVDPIPHPMGIMPRTAVVTESDVWRMQLDDPDYYQDYYAYGYVTMMDGSRKATHYSVAQMWYQGSLDKTGDVKWGDGRVDAWSYSTPNPGTAKIFYGTR